MQLIRTDDANCFYLVFLRELLGPQVLLDHPDHKEKRYVTFLDFNVNNNNIESGWSENPLDGDDSRSTENLFTDVYFCLKVLQILTFKELEETSNPRL